MKFSNIFFSLLVFLPIIGFFIYSALNPYDVAMWGERWKFDNEDIEPSDERIKGIRITSIIVIIIAILFLIVIIIKSNNM